MEGEDLYEQMQSGYRPHHSTETCLFKVPDVILCAMDCQKISFLILLDLSAAFDLVDHDILLERMSTRLGINGLALHWFRSYLDLRKQFVNINGATSSGDTLQCGVPQGSILGPILFKRHSTTKKEILLEVYQIR